MNSYSFLIIVFCLYKWTNPVQTPSVCRYLDFQKKLGFLRFYYCLAPNSIIVIKIQYFMRFKIFYYHSNAGIRVCCLKSLKRKESASINYVTMKRILNSKVYADRLESYSKNYNQLLFLLIKSDRIFPLANGLIYYFLNQYGLNLIFKSRLSVTEIWDFASWGTFCSLRYYLIQNISIATNFYQSSWNSCHYIPYALKLRTPHSSWWSYYLWIASEWNCYWQD